MSKKCYAIKFLTIDGNGPYQRYAYDMSGKWNAVNAQREIICCHYGLHACLVDSFPYYYRDYIDQISSTYAHNVHIRAFIVELGGKIDIKTGSSISKISAEKMRFIGEIPLVYLKSKWIGNYINYIRIYITAKIYGVLNSKQAMKLPYFLEIIE